MREWSEAQVEVPLWGAPPQQGAYFAALPFNGYDYDWTKDSPILGQVSHTERSTEQWAFHASIHHVWLSMLWSKGYPALMVGPFASPPTRAVFVNELNRPAGYWLTRIGQPVVNSACLVDGVSYRQVSLRCDCRAEQVQTWKWSGDRWCLTESYSVTSPEIPPEKWSNWCGRGEAPVSGLPLCLDTNLCPPDTTPDGVERGERRGCAKEAWFSTGAGRTIAEREIKHSSAIDAPPRAGVPLQLRLQGALSFEPHARLWHADFHGQLRSAPTRLD